MKKLVVLLMVLGMATMAQATVVSIVTAGAGSNGHAGTASDPLDIGETIPLMIQLDYNKYEGYPSYDGYFLYSMDLALSVSGNGSLGAEFIWNKAGDTIIGTSIVENSSWSVKPSLEDHYSRFSASGHTKLVYGALGGISGALPSGGAANTNLVSGFWLECTGEGQVKLGLTNNVGGEYYPYTASTNTAPFGELSHLTDGDLGSLTIYQIPEPMTIALLGLGGLGLAYRRRRA
jgi:hypothetical protein